MYKGRVYVAYSQELKNLVLKEMHNVPYVGHPGYPNTIPAVKKQYYWPGMKKEVVDFIARCLEHQKFKVEHRHPVGLLQPLPIPEWKWEVFTMDSITNLPNTTKQHDSIMVVVDKLTKVAHFIPVKLAHKATNIVDIYMREIARIHGVLTQTRHPGHVRSHQDLLFLRPEELNALLIPYRDLPTPTECSYDLPLPYREIGPRVFASPIATGSGLTNPRTPMSIHPRVPCFYREFSRSGNRHL
jgi:hypothetical protein